MPNTQALIEALAKQGLDLLPYAKYVAVAILGWYTFVGLVVIGMFIFVIYQFIKMNRDFNG